MSDTIKGLEKDIENKTTISCNHCDYKASSSVALKRHITVKHKELDIERKLSQVDDLQVSLPLEERAEDLHHSITNTSFECEVCKHKTTSSAELNGHIALKQDPSIPHTSKWEPNTCHICNESFSATGDFSDHMKENHGVTDGTHIRFQCDESSDLGLYHAQCHQAMVMECKSCVTIAEAESLSD